MYKLNPMHLLEQFLQYESANKVDWFEYLFGNEGFGSVSLRLPCVCLLVDLVLFIPGESARAVLYLSLYLRML